MLWTTKERAELVRQHERIGYNKGEPWPSVWFKPTDVLSVMRSVPDGAGLTGYVEALRRFPRPAWYRRWW